MPWQDLRELVAQGDSTIPQQRIGVATLPVIWFDGSPTFAIAVGAAAGMAAHARLILTAMLFAALLVGTQGFDAVPGVVLAAVAAWLTVSALDRRRAAGQAEHAPEPAQRVTVVLCAAAEGRA
jgi:H+/Cl- antiporter ClcA